MVDLVLFVLVIRSLYLMQRRMSSSKGGSTHLSPRLFMVLTVVMGLTWLFGILVNITTSPAVLYLFIISNAFTGLWLFLAYCMPQRVRSLYAAMFADRVAPWNMSRYTVTTTPARSSRPSMPGDNSAIEMTTHSVTEHGDDTAPPKRGAHFGDIKRARAGALDTPTLQPLSDTPRESIAPEKADETVVEGLEERDEF